MRIVVRGYNTEMVVEEIDAESVMAGVNQVLDKYRTEFDEIELDSASPMVGEPIEESEEEYEQA